MKKSHNLTLNIAGEKLSVVFDGDAVYSAWFPMFKLNSFEAKCGHEITQAMLVDICRRKVAELPPAPDEIPPII